MDQLGFLDFPKVYFFGYEVFLKWPIQLQLIIIIKNIVFLSMNSMKVPLFHAIHQFIVQNTIFWWSVVINARIFFICRKIILYLHNESKKISCSNSKPLGAKPSHHSILDILNTQRPFSANFIHQADPPQWSLKTDC